MAPPDTQSADTPLAGDFENPSRESWLEIVDKALKGGDFEKRLVSRTADGIRVEPLFTRDDELASAQNAVPGAAPFTRGVRASVEGEGWDIRQLHANGDPGEANKAILADLTAGVSSITLQMAAPGQFGLAGGVDALREALKDVRLDWARISFVPGMNFAAVLGDLHKHIESSAFPKSEIDCALNADPLGELARTGTLHKPLDDLLGEVVNGMALARDNYPKMRIVQVDARVYHESGATSGQELATLCATLVAYLRKFETLGVSPAEVLSRTAFTVSAKADIFLTIAKLRAARLLIAKIAEETGAGDGLSNLHITAVTSQRMMTKRDPWTNLLRTTTACAAAALGGADAITVLPFTWALGRADAFALRTARNIQLVCQEESSLGRVVDPAGGSWYVEKLTDDLANKAWELFQQIEAQGGLETALKEGFLQDLISKSCEERGMRLSTGREPLTGTSTFPFLADDGITAEPHEAAVAISSVPIIERPLAPIRLAAPFEALRDCSDIFKEKNGALPRVFLASLGTAADHTGRSTWIKNLLAAGGIEAVTHEGYDGPQQAAQAFKDSNTEIACICSNDEIYKEHGVATLKALKEAGASHVYLAGRAGSLEGALASAGLTGSLSAGQDSLSVLRELHEALNIPKA